MPTLIAILIFIAWSAFAWAKPRTAFACLPFALPFYLVRLKIGPLPTTALEMVVLATIASELIRFFYHPKRLPNPWTAKLFAPKGSFDPSDGSQDDKWRTLRPWLLPCGLWLIAGAVSVIVAPDKIAALGLYRAYFVEPVLIFIVGLGVFGSRFESNNQTPNAEPRRSLLRNLYLVAIIFGAWAIFQFLTGIGLPEDYAPAAIRRSVGPFPYPNALALLVVPVVAFAFAERVSFLQTRNSTLETPPLPAWLGWLTIAAGLTAIALAKSDGGLIAVIAAAFVALVLNRRTRIPAIAVAVIAAIAIFAIPQTRTPVMNQVLFKEWSGKVRVIMWKETVTMLKDRPVFGAGLAAYPTVIAPYHKATWMEIFQYPHNILLNLWSETGVLGVLAFGWILWVWAIGRTEPDARRVRFAMAFPVITALLVHGLVDVPYFKNDLAILFWLLILVTFPRPHSTANPVSITHA